MSDNLKRDLEVIVSEKRGAFISFEGGEGCGKSTQFVQLFSFLEEQDYSVLKGREPGGTALGEHIRSLLLSRNDYHMWDLTELFLFQASRVQYVRDLVIPHVLSGGIFLSDRFYDSTLAYQGCAGGVDVDLIKTTNQIASCGLAPHLTILIDIDEKQGLKIRSGVSEKDRIESKALEYHARVNEGFRQIAGENPDRVKVVPFVYNGAEVMQEQIRVYVSELLGTRNVSKKKK